MNAESRLGMFTPTTIAPSTGGTPVSQLSSQ